MNKKIIIPSLVAVAVIGGATLAGTTSAFADVKDSSLTQTKKVEKATERKAKMEASLETAVTDGKLTAAQKATLEEKLSAIADQRKALHESGASRADMKTAKDSSRDSLKTWAEQNNITLKDILPQHVKHGGPAHKKTSTEQ